MRQWCPPPLEHAQKYCENSKEKRIEYIRYQRYSWGNSQFMTVSVPLANSWLVAIAHTKMWVRCALVVMTTGSAPPTGLCQSITCWSCPEENMRETDRVGSLATGSSYSQCRLWSKLTQTLSFYRLESEIWRTLRKQKLHIYRVLHKRRNSNNIVVMI